MNKPICNKCNDTDWVCENHSDQEAHKCKHCEGAGILCECIKPKGYINGYQLIIAANDAITDKYKVTDNWIINASIMLYEQEKKLEEFKMEIDIFIKIINNEKLPVELLIHLNPLHCSLIGKLKNDCK
jgi:NAD-dependent SIR2 family protein deacetylase